jgi:hypothetical protein
MIPSFPYGYLVYKDGSLYKADKHNPDGSVGLISQNADAITVLNAVKTDAGLVEARVHLRNATYDLASSLSTTTGVNGRMHWSGENQHGTILRPTGNFPALIVNNYNNAFENIKILVDQGAPYTSDALQILAQNGQSISMLDLDRIFIEHRTGGGLQQNGNGINIKLTGTCDSAWSWLNSNNIRIDGLQTAISNDSQGSAGSNSWNNEMAWTRVKCSGSFNFFKSNLKAGHVSDGWYWDKCAWQTTGVDGTTGDMFYLDDGAQRHYQWSMSHCFGWDFANNNHKFLKVRPSSYVSLFGCTPDGEINMGGSGYKNGAVVIRAGSQYGPRRGQSTFSGNGIGNEFAIAPALYGSDGGGVADIRNYLIYVTSASVDGINESCGVRTDNMTSTTFQVRFKNPPRAANPPGTQNVIVNWEIQGYA